MNIKQFIHKWKLGYAIGILIAAIIVGGGKLAFDYINNHSSQGSPITYNTPSEQFCGECASPRCNPHSAGCSDCGPAYDPCPLQLCVADFTNNPRSYLSNSFENKKCTDLFFEVHPTFIPSGDDLYYSLTERYNTHSNPGYTARILIEHGADFHIENDYLLIWAFQNRDAEPIIAMLDKGLDPHLKNNIISKFAVIYNQTNLTAYLTSKGINPYNYNFSTPIPFVSTPQDKVTHCDKNEFIIHLTDKQCDEFNPGDNITCHNISEYNRCVT